MDKEARLKRRQNRKENGKSFFDTGVGKFLKGSSSSIVNIIGDVLPDKGVLGIVKNLISKDDNLSAEDKEHALKLLEFDIIEQQEITKRWEADAHSDSWLSKNIRPMVLGYLILCTSILIVCDSVFENFEVAPHWVTLLSSLLLTTVGGYFALREFGKYASKKYQ